MDLKEMIFSDAYRIRGRSGCLEVARAFLKSRTFRPIFTLRMCQALHAAGGLGKVCLPFAKILHRFACHQAAMDLPWKTKIGPGFSIVHGWGLVITEGAVIGANVTLFHGVTLGRSDAILNGERNSRYPTLDSNVWVGPNAIVVGDANIGFGCRIAGGTFVFKSVESRCMVAGNPARVIKTCCEPDVMNPAEV